MFIGPRNGFLYLDSPARDGTEGVFTCEMGLFASRTGFSVWDSRDVAAVVSTRAAGDAHALHMLAPTSEASAILGQKKATLGFWVTPNPLHVGADERGIHHPGPKERDTRVKGHP